jgi:hypothetical protein
MKLIFLLCAFLCLPFTESNHAHEFHVSKCEIDYNTSENALQITLHIFLDDLELSMLAQGAEKQFLCTEKELENAETVYFEYLKENFQINLNNGELADYQWIGKEISDDLAAVWTYLEVPNVTDLSGISVKNTVLMDVHDDQKNIVQIKGGGARGYFLLQRGKEKQSVSF